MAKKKKQDKETTISDFYDLKVNEIDDLVSALKDEPAAEEQKPVTTDIKEITGEEVTGKQKDFDPYRHDLLSRIPGWLKALFIKWFFAGATCFFFAWGINYNDDLDRVFFTGLALGLVVEMLVNPIFHFMQTDEKDYDNYMMFPFPFKAYWTFFTNVVYYLGVTFVVNYCYLGANLLGNVLHGTKDVYYLGVEPIMFGVFTLAVDMALIGVKDLVVYLVKRSKQSKEEENV